MTHRRHGRKQPYTEIGIRRIPCYRCGKTAVFQWQACADNRLFRPLCTSCDVDLNRLVLEWMGDPQANQKMDAYVQKILTPSPAQ